MMSDNYEPSQEERNLAMICHLGAFAGFVIPIPFIGIIVPLVIWQTKKDESSYVDFHGKEAVNFQLSVAIAYLIGFVLLFVIIGFLILPAVALLNLVFVIIAAIKANEGAYYSYPVTLRLIK